MTHADMLRELQSLIASEREGKEALGLQVRKRRLISYEAVSRERV